MLYKILISMDAFFFLSNNIIKSINSIRCFHCAQKVCRKKEILSCYLISSPLMVMFSAQKAGTAKILMTFMNRLFGLSRNHSRFIVEVIKR